MPKKTLSQVDEASLRGRRVLVRADLNVPLADGRITDDRRIRATLPTLEYLSARGARVVLMSHLGRPKGEVRPELSLQPVARRLAELLGVPVSLAPGTTGSAVEGAVDALENGSVLLLENTRFLPGETANDPTLAQGLARLGDLFVNDAFGAAHRAQSSTTGVAEAVRRNGGEAVAGFLMARELQFLGEALDDPRRPFLAILGGAKISGKIDVVEALLPRVDRLLVGGAMANTFFRALGLETGASLVEDDRVDMAREVMERAGDKLILPVDCVVAAEIAPEADTRVVGRSAVAPADRIGDVGDDTRVLFAREILGARTVVWNGPMGVFEMEPFARGTVAVAHAVAEACDAGAVGVLGGGDSAAAAAAAGVSDRLTHVSTGGGAFLEFLAGAQLPGLAALNDEEE